MNPPSPSPWWPIFKRPFLVQFIATIDTLDIALQEEISNHLKLLCLRDMVVSVEEKAC